MAAEALADLRDGRAVAPLLAALEDPAAEVRYWAAFALGELGDPQALPAWLIQTTLHKVSKWRRRNERFVPHDGTQTENAPAPDADMPDALIRDIQQTQALRDAVTALSDRCQRMVHMLFFETPARPYKDVAAQLGVATGSIGFLRSRCLDRLRSALEGIALCK